MVLILIQTLRIRFEWFESPFECSSSFSPVKDQLQNQFALGQDGMSHTTLTSYLLQV